MVPFGYVCFTPRNAFLHLECAQVKFNITTRWRCGFRRTENVFGAVVRSRKKEIDNRIPVWSPRIFRYEGQMILCSPVCACKRKTHF